MIPNISITLNMLHIRIERYSLQTGLIASSDYSDDNKEVAISWLSELTRVLGTRLNEYRIGQNENTH